jgi:DNA-binding response OmpR family regulator
MKSRLLVVEDDRELMQLLDLALTDIGSFSIRQCLDATSALAAVDDGYAPDLALLDLNLPDMDGTELMQQIRARGHDRLPVVFLTGTTDEAVRNNLLDQGATGILTKPFNPMTLADEIRPFLENSEAD